MPTGASPSVQEMVAADHCGIRIGKQGECVSGFARQVAGDFRGIHADGHRPHAGMLEFSQVLLYAS